MFMDVFTCSLYSVFSP